MAVIGCRTTLVTAWVVAAPLALGGLLKNLTWPAARNTCVLITVLCTDGAVTIFVGSPSSTLSVWVGVVVATATRRSS